jgi:hypothetical protein
MYLSSFLLPLRVKLIQFITAEASYNFIFDEKSTVKVLHFW